MGNKHNDPPKSRRREPSGRRGRVTTILLPVYFFVAMIIPNCVLANTEHYSVWTTEALILLPLGFFMMWSVALRRSGVKAGLVRPKRLFPFPKDALNALVPQTKKFFAVELSGGQMIEDVKLAIECRRPVELIHRVGGKLISVEELVAKVKAAAGTHL